MEFLIEYKWIIVLVHAISAAIGLGAAVVTDTMFFKFLKNYKIAPHEHSMMDTLSKVIWFALGALIVTGVLLYLPRAEVLNETPKFLVKALIVGIILLNGILLNIFISPYLTKISFGKEHAAQSRNLRFLRRLAYASGGLSIVSWFSVFIFGSISNWGNLTFWQILSGYLVLVVMAVTGSQIFDRLMKRERI